MAYDPVSVALKFAFLGVLFLFLLVIARSALKDLRGTASPAPDGPGSTPSRVAEVGGADAWLVVGPGRRPDRDQRFDLFGGLTIGRSEDADVQITDRFASGSTPGPHPRQRTIWSRTWTPPTARC